MASTMKVGVNNSSENIPFKGKAYNENLTREEAQGRRCLKTIQISTQTEKQTTSKSEKGKEKKTHILPIKGGSQPVQVYVDRNENQPVLSDVGNKILEEKGTQTECTNNSEEEIDQEAWDLMVREPIPETYWKQMAESRREALNDSLCENEKLHKQVEALQGENEKLTVLASQAEYFATVIQTVLADSADTELEREEKKSDEDNAEEEEEDASPKVLAEPTSG